MAGGGINFLAGLLGGMAQRKGMDYEQKLQQERFQEYLKSVQDQESRAWQRRMELMGMEKESQQEELARMEAKQQEQVGKINAAYDKYLKGGKGSLTAEEYLLLSPIIQYEEQMALAKRGRGGQGYNPQSDPDFLVNSFLQNYTPDLPPGSMDALYNSLYNLPSATQEQKNRLNQYYTGMFKSLPPGYQGPNLFGAGGEGQFQPSSTLFGQMRQPDAWKNWGQGLGNLWTAGAKYAYPSPLVNMAWRGESALGKPLFSKYVAPRWSLGWERIKSIGHKAKEKLPWWNE